MRRAVLSLALCVAVLTGGLQAQSIRDVTYNARFRWNAKPFFVTAIFHDGQFTYIRTAGNELPALYEVRDRAPNLVNFQVQDGLYIVPKVLEAGYLVIGEQQLVFDQAR